MNNQFDAAIAVARVIKPGGNAAVGPACGSDFATGANGERRYLPHTAQCATLYVH